MEETPPAGPEGAEAAPRPTTSMVPPPPRFSSGPSRELMPPPPAAPPSSAASGQQAAEARKKAAKAAAAAAADATPGQRERAVQEAVAELAAAAALAKDAPAGSATDADQSARTDEKKEAAPAPPRETPPTIYDPPDWGGPPEGIPYKMEVLKSGQVVESIGLGSQNHYTFGRLPDNHVRTDHPSLSRLHAVIQFEAGTGNPFLYDNLSAHGTFLNKKRLKPKVYAPMRVGDMVKFGQSSRIYVLQGPEELMPEEGPSRQQRREMALLGAQQDRMQREAQVAKAQMAQALAKGGVGSNSQGASWGLLGEDAVEEVTPYDDESFDWRIHAETKGLTDKQQKIADRVRKFEWKIKNMQTEAERIRAKESGPDGLTVGQATQLQRNEQAIEKLNDEMEDAEEALLESLRASLRDKNAASASAEAASERRKRRRHKGDEEDEDEEEEDEDDFYDRTGKAKKAKAVGAKKGGKRPKAAAMSVQELFGKKEALLVEAKRLEKAILLEEAVGAGEDVEGQAEPGADPLDAFMTGMATQAEADKVNKLRAELEECRAEVERMERLMKIADPDGWFRPTSKAAGEAKAKAASELLLAKQRKAAAEAARLAAAQRQADEVPFVPEEEEEEKEQGGLQIHPLASNPRTPVTSTTDRQSPASPSKDLPSPSATTTTTATTAALRRTQPQVQEAAVGRQQAQETKPKAKPHGKGGLAGLLSREDVAQQMTTGAERPPAKDLHSRAAASVADTLAILSRNKQHGRMAEQQQEEEVGADWKPPEGQTGDGRTALNDKLGY